jgi:hypothetical protein
MEGLAAAIVLIAVLPGVPLVAAFDLFCLARLAARDDRGFRRKLAWAVAIVCTSPFGGPVLKPRGRASGLAETEIRVIFGMPVPDPGRWPAIRGT